MSLHWEYDRADRIADIAFAIFLIAFAVFAAFQFGRAAGHFEAWKWMVQ